MHIPHYFCTTTWIKEANNFQKQKFSLRVLDFAFFFQPGVAYKQACSSIEVIMGFINSRSSHRRCSIKVGVLKNLKNSHTRTTGSVIQIIYNTIQLFIQYKLFISHSMFYFSLEYLCSHGFSAWKLPSTCLLNPFSVSGYLMICTTWLINFQIVLFYMKLSSVYLFSFQQIRKLIAEM